MTAPVIDRRRTVLDTRARTVVDAASAMLETAGFDSGRVADVMSTAGRNDSAIITFDDETKVFFKQIRGIGGEARYARSAAFFDALDVEVLGFSTPGLLASDDDALAALYEFVDDGPDASQRFRAGEIGTVEYVRIGSLLAQLHGARVVRADRIDHSVPPLPPTGINAIPVELYAQSTMGQLDMWKLLQGDAELRSALSRLIVDGRQVDRSPVHGDLRLDQIVLGASAWILDWEEFRLGDPARDVGGVLGELFYYRMRRIVDGASDDLTEGLTHEEVMRRGAGLLAESLPDMQTVWKSYLGTASCLGDGASFSARCVGYFGWQLFDRALASGTAFGRVSALDRALAGIGREAMVRNERYVSALGLEAAV
ncbi:phosphotransferase [Rhodococcus sp. NPDC078407]|uniref:phosphotransferase n=1 Tax=Rhodococcus sp. NPDC078407 TaxID=3364509 RepID=UPI0037C62096